MKEHNLQIESIAKLMTSDDIPLDEQDPQKLQKYHVYAKNNFGLDDDAALQLVYEALLYLKLKDGGNFDPLKQGEKFGSGFS